MDLGGYGAVGRMPSCKVIFQNSRVDFDILPTETTETDNVAFGIQERVV